ncbi:MAG: DUF3795 domain-containing protein [Anaerolineales bacterium]|jgi:hypothetical protein
MTEIMIAKCGLECTKCGAYIATQNNDLEALQKMADEAKKQYNLDYTAEQSRCTGCLSDGVKIQYTDQCEVRRCAVERGVENCAYCDEYGCETISGFLANAPKAKENLEKIRVSLS